MANNQLTGALGGAASGAGTGFMLGGPIGAGIGALAGGIIGFVGGSAADEQATAAQNMSMAQLAEARRSRELASGFAAPTADELDLQSRQLSSIGQQMSFQMQELHRAEQMLNTINPSAMAASKNLLSLLQGGKSEMEQPIEYQRTQGRKKLEDSLRQQMGAGFATSTAGQQALQNYDRQTSELLQQTRFAGMSQMAQISAQQGALGQSIAGGVNQGFGSTGALLGQALNNKGSIQQRQISAVLGTPMTNYAGAQYTAEGLQAGYAKDRMQNVLGSGMILASMMGGGSKPSIPTTMQMPTQSPWKLGDYSFGNTGSFS